MPHPTPLGQGVGEIGALVGLLIQRWSPRVGPNVYREKVVTAHAQTLSCLLMVKKWLMILWIWCILVQKLYSRPILFMSNQAMTYESLKEAIRQEFEDILEPEQTFFLQKRSDLKEMGVFIDIRPGAIIPDTLGDLH